MHYQELPSGAKLGLGKENLLLVGRYSATLTLGALVAAPSPQLLHPAMARDFIRRAAAGVSDSGRPNRLP